VQGADLVDREKRNEYERQKAIVSLFINPFDGDAHLRQGRHLLAAGKVEQAYTHLNVALTFRPDLHLAYDIRARAAFRLKRWNDAITDASMYLKHIPDDDSTRVLRADAYRLVKRYDEAIRDYTTILERFPRAVRYYELRAVCHAALGHAEEAKADRETAFKLDPTDPTAKNNVAWLLVTGPQSQRDPQRALRLIQEAVKQEPDNAMFLNTLGVAQYRNQMYAEAILTLEKSLAAGKGQFDAFDLFFLAMCHAKLDDKQKAKECYDRAVKWVNQKKDLSATYVEELKQFRAEAELLLKQP
jgi:tetratricopeptide (TPR) repeat protein